MNRCFAVVSAIFVCVGVGRAEPFSINTIGASTPGEVDTSSLGLESIGFYGDFNIETYKTHASAAFGQTFQVDAGSTFTVTDFSFYLNNADGAPLTLASTEGPGLVGYIMEWDGGTTGATQFVASTPQVAAADGYTAYTVETGGVDLVGGEDGANYVAFFSAIDVDGSLPKKAARIGGFKDNSKYANGSAVVSRYNLTSLDQITSSGGFVTLDYADLAFAINGVVGGGGDNGTGGTDGGGDGGTAIVGHSPEPASCLMWAGLGLAGLAYGWRRRRPKRARSLLA